MDPLPVVQSGSETISGTPRDDVPVHRLEVAAARRWLCWWRRGDVRRLRMVVKMAVLQHRDVVWQLERKVRLSEDMVTRGGRRNE
ncbi:hypothetical protein NC653_019992 [Populus alba x Populus x berolinensis]|uniref:Uncharacterized protein n=1 Tax=Populus alba x Populus x berolinensis TaxID=444605 RepID=A0AAD6QC27_9ROSI|nr:hypothetical protein NC653_019992 [Populus alba x Populus x berolinensis]